MGFFLVHKFFSYVKQDWLIYLFACKAFDTVSVQLIYRLLLGVAYYFSNGPFLKFWIKKGYDPRKDPDSRM